MMVPQSQYRLYRGKKDIVREVFYEIDPDEKPIINWIESMGSGHAEKYVWIVDTENSEYYTQFCRAMQQWIDDHLVPVEWYKEYVVRGAIDHALSENFIINLKGILSVEDPERVRREEHFIVLTSLG